MECKEYVKYLGVLIGSTLSWKHHIDYIVCKISKTVGIIANIRRFVPSDILLKISYSLIFPYTHYGIVAWGQAAETHMSKILLLQKRVLRFIYRMEYRAHTIPLFISANILPINMLYLKMWMLKCMMYHLALHPLKYQISLLNLRKSTHIIQDFLMLAIIMSTNQGLINNFLHFQRLGPKVWNNVPRSLCSLPKRSLKRPCTFVKITQEWKQLWL